MTAMKAGGPCALDSSSRGVLNVEIQRKRGLDSTDDVPVRSALGLARIQKGNMHTVMVVLS